MRCNTTLPDKFVIELGCPKCGLQAILGIRRKFLRLVTSFEKLSAKNRLYNDDLPPKKDLHLDKRSHMLSKQLILPKKEKVINQATVNKHGVKPDKLQKNNRYAAHQYFRLVKCGPN